MEENEPVEKKRKPSPPRGGSREKKSRAHHPPELRLRAVKLHLEEGFTMKLVADELGVSQQTISHWVQLYRTFGEQRLVAPSSGPKGPRLHQAVTDKILEIKEQNPTFGIKRISQVLRRWFFLEASPETVRHRLKDEGLLKAPAPARRNMTRPRFFERATPNQMWQTDIFTFRLGGRYAYLIAFMDDYSRFITGADLFRSPTAHNVLEVFRVASGEYQPPKEMLTDQGRQYTAWRGTSRFETEMKKSGIHHFKSRAHHPMTLGKVERFWETIWQEFLSRAQFESFESARERIRFWIRYYNHKRPHQGIEGLCPADRFFEIATDLRKTIEAGIQENLLEMALRGQPKAPFYMVGRMEGQSVILRAEKGKLKLSIEDANRQSKELVYDLKQNQDPKTTASLAGLLSGGEGSSHPGSLDGALPVDRSLPSDEHRCHHLQPMATTSDGGNVAGPGIQSEPGQRRGLESTTTNAPAEAAENDQHPQASHQTGADPACQSGGLSCKNTVDDFPREASHSHSASQSGPDHGPGSSAPVGNLPPGLLPVGEQSPQSIASSLGATAQGTPKTGIGSGEGTTAQPGGGTGTEAAPV